MLQINQYLWTISSRVKPPEPLCDVIWECTSGAAAALTNLADFFSFLWLTFHTKKRFTPITALTMLTQKVCTYCFKITQHNVFSFLFTASGKEAQFLFMPGWHYQGSFSRFISVFGVDLFPSRPKCLGTFLNMFSQRTDGKFTFFFFPVFWIIGKQWKHTTARWEYFDNYSSSSEVVAKKELFKMSTLEEKQRERERSTDGKDQNREKSIRKAVGDRWDLYKQ